MLAIITGPAGGPQARFAQQTVDGPCLWMAFDRPPDHAGASTMVLSSMTYRSLAVFAERLAHPTWPKERLAIMDFSAIATHRAVERAPVKADLDDTPELAKLCAEIHKGQLPPPLIIHSFSSLYDRVHAEIMAKAIGDWGEKGIEAARTLASNALARISWDLAIAPIDVILTAWDVETTFKGKVNGIAPAIPKATLSQADFIMRVEQAGKLTILSDHDDPAAIRLADHFAPLEGSHAS